MYFGSVRFFKHLILGLLVLLITVPLAVSVVLGVQNHAYRAQLGLLPKAEGDTGMRAAAAGFEETLPPKADEPEPSPEPPAYQSLYPELYAPEAARGTVDEEKTVYLTFDDGPTARTPQILEILERYGVKASFFAVGGEDEQSKQWMRDVAAAGHTLGAHSYSHDYKKIYASAEAYLEDFHQIYTLIYDATGAYPTVFRLPGGSVNGYNAGVYKDILAEMERRGFACFDWSVDAADTAANVKTENVVRRALAGTADRRAIVLLHDGDGGAALAALPAIIEGYQAAGFTFAVLTPEVRQVILG